MQYAFIDPPFGENLAYSELNFIPESWIRVFTHQPSEAIVSKSQAKKLGQYQTLMSGGLSNVARALEPGRWVTVEFSNTRASVWNALQNAIERAGLVVSTVAALDKKQLSFNAVTTPTSVKQDLVISAYKPSPEAESAIREAAGTIESAWSFIRQHLSFLPIFLGTPDSAEIVIERTAHRLLDRMIAYHVQRQLPVPIDRAAFFLGIEQRFAERDGMYFLPDQVAEYDRRRIKAGELKQLSLFVNDEASAIQWMRQQLHLKPRRRQDIQPLFMKELQTWAKHEATIELKVLLEQNFLIYDGAGALPSQIHSYLSTNFKDLRNRDKDDPQLIDRAMGRWYVPDPNKQSDLEMLRERALLREFEDYRDSKQRKLKQFRSEAVRAGFKAAYDEGDYSTIVSVARKISDSVLQEDDKLLMYYDVATMRLGEDA